MRSSPAIHGSSGGKWRASAGGVDERHVHRLLGLPDVGRVGDEQRHHRERGERQPLRPQQDVARDLRPPAPPHEPAGARQQQHGDDPHRQPLRHELQRAGHPHQPRREQQPERLGERDAAPGQAREHDRRQRRRRQPQYLDQHEEAQRGGHRLPETLMSGPVVTTYERVADLPLTIEDYVARGSRARHHAGVRSPYDDVPPPRRRRGGPRRGRHLRPRGAARAAAARADAPARRRVDVRTSSPATSAALDLFPAGEPAAAGLPPLPPLGDRERRARPRAPPGRPLARRRARARAAPGRRSSSRCGSATRRASSRWPTGSRSTRGCASSSTARPTGPAS